MNHRKQLTVLLILLIVYALSAFLSYTFFLDQLTAFAGVPIPETDIPPFVFGLANAGTVLVLYGLLGLIGYWFAFKLGLPGIFSEDGNWRRWFFIPLLIGIISGVALIIGDMIFAQVNGYGKFPHPAFPASFFASLSAGIGEEIIFRGFVFGLWGFILNWLLKRFNGRTAALWIANVIAALAFGAGHLGTCFSDDRRFHHLRSESCFAGGSFPAQRHRRYSGRRTLYEGWVGRRSGSPLLDGYRLPCAVRIVLTFRISHVRLYPSILHRPKVNPKSCTPVKPSWINGLLLTKN